MIEFLAMGGHGPYVWGSYGVALVVLVAELVLLSRRRTAMNRRLARLARLNRENGAEPSPDS
ncbi:heme exporter protein CcmD [Ectothiorhodospira lacustris]|uniref:heme exporter protein CcmD n=1 Tax=Ectothiorhodospira lacustris TaxID=2899127 RepID=UPI001EE88663|nr:heme exporter protein CcmD [Ectothiorhodospira lacustris]MCG5499853.1 heme exporter protein CcmD [Ectothiorhodospira lacustris]MCG5509001.1 heme exporter protein CcmD [Ectothiorhodospira lacustris]MCG5520792.1 heme exporter protein CcmD [Ectothiorhodospira lacustris]